MRSTPVRFSRSHGGASRRRASFAKATTASASPAPVTLVAQNVARKASTSAVKAA
ncbi:hypothetical protein [Vibrio ulleungensis]|uniref:Uncharacterized protein n=1 Tax=Vibrio ulleungensis TaxID=2807619 RepID=A0ABS2HR73_9VIBR|nr:hypothetical protein [Vibrio ulleungensis]MBM7038549.1 hypothetical protein [Vibrio ulleungensis]